MAKKKSTKNASKNTNGIDVKISSRYFQPKQPKQNFLLSREIIVSESSVPNLRKEIRRVFQVANRRIQNIQQSGIYSPAVAALDVESINEFSKFSVSGKSWTQIKIEYAKAIEFLRHPTSTASGAKQYAKHIQTELKLSDKQMQTAFGILRENGSLIMQQGEKYNLKKLLADYFAETKDISEQLETAAQKLDNVSDLTNPLLQDLKENYMDMPETDLGTVLSALHELGK